MIDNKFKQNISPSVSNFSKILDDNVLTYLFPSTIRSTRSRILMHIIPTADHRQRNRDELCTCDLFERDTTCANQNLNFCIIRQLTASGHQHGFSWGRSTRYSQQAAGPGVQYNRQRLSGSSADSMLPAK